MYLMVWAKFRLFNKENADADAVSEKKQVNAFFKTRVPILEKIVYGQWHKSTWSLKQQDTYFLKLGAFTD